MKTYAVAILFLVACGGSKDSKDDKGGGDKETSRYAGKVASCLQAKVQSCREYRDDNLYAGLDNLSKLCSIASPGEFKEVACPTDKVIGTCSKRDGKDYFYEGNPITAAEQKKYCTEAGGTYADK